MNPRTQFNIVVAVLVVAVGLLTFSGLPISDMRASVAVWPSQPGVLFSAPTETGAISGHIFKADGVTVITDVLIRVHASGVSAGTSSLGTYASQTDGSYTISGLAPGTYKVQCNNNGVGNYISEYYNNKLSRDQADIITVVAGQTATGIDFALDVGGSISCHVFKEDGISVITDTIITVGAEGVSSGDAVVSQADGSYTISGLAPGTYKVQGNTKRVGGYVDKWYNNKYVWSQADTIVVSAGQAVTGIDFNLEAGGAVSGHVFKADGVSVITDVTIMVQAGRVSPAPGGLGVRSRKLTAAIPSPASHPAPTKCGATAIALQTISLNTITTSSQGSSRSDHGGSRTDRHWH